MGLPADIFLQDIFGKTNDGVHYEGLVDAKDSSDFSYRLDLLEEGNGVQYQCPLFFCLV